MTALCHPRLNLSCVCHVDVSVMPRVCHGVHESVMVTAASALGMGKKPRGGIATSLDLINRAVAMTPLQVSCHQCVIGVSSVSRRVCHQRAGAVRRRHRRHRTTSMRHRAAHYHTSTCSSSCGSVSSAEARALLTKVGIKCLKNEEEKAAAYELASGNLPEKNCEVHGSLKGCGGSRKNHVGDAQR